jgi:hypothetical protein
MEGLLIAKRAELAELEKKLALEKEQLNLDVAKSIFADENVAFYKKLHAFFTTRVTGVKVSAGILIIIDGGYGVTRIQYEEEDGKWHLRLYVNGETIILDDKTRVDLFPEMFGSIGVKTQLELLIFLGAFEAFITKYLSESKRSEFQARWRK